MRNNQFSRFSEIIYGVSNKKFGDMSFKHDSDKAWINITNFLKKLGLKKENLVLMEQVHGNRIKIVDEKDCRKIISGVDGLVTTRTGVVLGAKTADCLPVMFYSPAIKGVGIAHVGWRGVIGGIIPKMIDCLIKLGSLPEEIFIRFGPALCDRCNIQKRPLAQEQKPEWKGYLYPYGDKMRIEMGRFCLGQIIQSGVLTKNVSHFSCCTKENWTKIYSYEAAQEKGTEKEEGLFLSVISLNI